MGILIVQLGVVSQKPEFAVRITAQFAVTVGLYFAPTDTVCVRQPTFRSFSLRLIEFSRLARLDSCRDEGEVCQPVTATPRGGCFSSQDVSVSAASMRSITCVASTRTVYRRYGFELMSCGKQ